MDIGGEHVFHRTSVVSTARGDLENAAIDTKALTANDRYHHSHLLVREQYSKDYDFLKKLDDRLFPDFPLYCEGMPRPKLRGVLHLFCALLFPLGFWHLFLTANQSTRGKLAVFVYIFGNFFCCLVSAFYHMGQWSAANEIVMQKLDHMGIAICTACVNFPVALLLLPKFWGNLLGFISAGVCLWTCYNIFNNRPGVWRLVLTAMVILPFFPLLWMHLTGFEFLCVVGNSLSMSLGAYVFTTHWPDPVPTLFGYHEVFHVFTVIGFLCIYMCNWSVVHRVCNPYAHELDVTVILTNYFFSQYSYSRP
jgi:hemolysin III